MVFSSPVFLFYFLPLVLLLYQFSRGSIYLQNVLLLFSSLLFYFWGEKEFTLLVIFSIMLNYGLGLAIAALRFKKLLLSLGVVVNLSLLIYFKYYNFILNDILHHLMDIPKLRLEDQVHLPLGVSFFTFHGLTYIIDIFRKEAEVSKSPLNVGLYILFFPQLIAGPIVRYRDIDQQLRQRSITPEQLHDGVRRFILGFAKKILIANTLGAVADQIFTLPREHISGNLSWLALLCYSLQIYFDFSGYSDMAIGLARMMGFEFRENFNFPYVARSLRDFWRRWHISLSTFFRDYVYIPLGGSKHGPVRTYLNLFIIFFLTGLWHGASWNYLIWGLFHGFFLVLERAGFGKWLDRMPGLLARSYTLFVVMIAWLFFRIEETDAIVFFLQKLFFLNTYSSGAYFPSFFLQTKVVLALLAGCWFCAPLPRSPKIPGWMVRLKDNTLVLYLLFLLSIFVMTAATYNPFIYFRF